MRFNPAFIQLKKSIDEANNFRTSIDNANPQRSWLKLCPNEVYNQYILLDDDIAEQFAIGIIQRLELCDTEGKVINNNVGFGFVKFAQKNTLFLSFKLLEDYGDKCICLRLSIAYSQPFGRTLILYSNLFTCSEINKEQTSIVTYKHAENHYEIPYRDIPVMTNEDEGFSKSNSNQIRLPLYYLKKKTEQDSTENTYATNTPTNINVGRVNRRQIKIWQTIASDFINERIAIVSDTDYVYVNGQREITRPYEFEEVSNGSDFSLSLLESQPVIGDQYLDENGLVNHRPVITAINFPDDDCCNPDGSIIEPTIVSEETLPDTCEFGGKRKKFIVNGQPNATITYRLSMSSMSGSAKVLKVYNDNNYNQHIFNSVANVFIGFFYLDDEGVAELNFSCCFEQCVPGTTTSINATLRLYHMDNVSLTDQTCNLTHTRNCPLPYSPKWQINSETGTNEKNLSITGEENTIAVFVVKIISQKANFNQWPPNYMYVEGYMNQNLVETNDQWEFSVPIGPTGVSDNFTAATEAGSYIDLAPPEANIYVSLTLKDENGNLSSEIVGLSDIKTP